MSSYQPSKIYKLITSSNFKGTYKNVFYMNTLGDFDSIHLNSLLEFNSDGILIVVKSTQYKKLA